MWSRLTVAVLLLSVVFAGCFGADEKPEPTPVPDPNYTGNTTAPPAPTVPVIPPCAIEAGDVSWPSGQRVTAPSLGASATIKRDAYGVPHIYADDMYSLWYANGYAQAQDRLFELDLLRHVGRGNSAEIVGASQLSSDIEVNRELYTEAEINAQWDAAPDFAKDVLLAYADGVNRYAEEAAARNELPGEFPALGHTFEEWIPQDSVAVINYLIGFFGVDGGAELGNLKTLAQLQQVLPEEEAWSAFQDLVWLRIDDTYTTIPMEDKIINGCEDSLPRAAVDHQLRFLNASLDAVTFGTPPGGEMGYGPFPPQYTNDPKGEGVFEGFKWGSNAFLADPSITDTGKSIMWGAPQMGYYKPPVPYQVGLHGPDIDAVGIGVAGAPALVIGRNAHIAWSATSGMEDQADIIELELDGPRSYIWDNASKDMTCWTVEHQTAPAPAELPAFPDVAPPQRYVQQVCRAEGWPVVAINEDAGVAWAKKWTTKNEELPGAFIWLGLSAATSVEEFQAMAADFPFTFNFHVADNDDVLYLHTGNIPLRAPGFDPRLPTPAGSDFAWTAEAVTGGMGTWAMDPSTGYFANWNNGPAYGWRAGDQPGLWGPVHRVQAEDRTIQAYLADGQLTYEDVAAANWDSARTDSLAMPFLPYLIEAGNRDPAYAEMTAALQEWLDANVPWRDGDGDGKYDDPAHAIWDELYAEMLIQIQGDELGELNHDLEFNPIDSGDPHAGDHGQHRNPLATILKALRGTSEHDWCDDVTTEATENCDATLQAVFAAAKETLTAAYGEDVSAWLRTEHKSTFTSMGASTPDAMPMVNRGSWVQIVALGEGLDGAGSAMPPGNIGRINGPETARWVADGTEPDRLTLELDLYWSGQYKPFPLTEEEVDSVATSEETLVIL